MGARKRNVLDRAKAPGGRARPGLDARLPPETGPVVERPRENGPAVGIDGNLRGVVVQQWPRRGRKRLQATFYTEFDGRRPKRLIIKVLGE